MASTVIRMHETGGPSVLVAEQESIGSPGAGEVKLRHQAIGVNFIDTMFRSGAFPASLPFVTGVEASGVIEEVGKEVRDFRPGDRVAYFFAPGAYAAERLIETAPLVHLPDDIPADVAAGMLTKGITAWLAVRHLHPVKPGDTVLVQGATGGVGSLVARWAKHLGATVIGVGSESKLDRISAVVDHALASDQPDLSARIRRAAPNGVDVVYEFVGKATFAASASAVKDGGVIFTIGAASGPPDVDQPAFAARNIRVEHAGAASIVSGDLLQSAASEVFERWRKGDLGSIKLDRYALDEAAIAHSAIEARTIGPNPILIP